MRRFVVAAAAVLAGMAGPLAPLHAAQFQYYVAPLQGITGLSQSALTSGAAEKAGQPKYGGMIDQKYADLLLGGAAQRALIGQFNQAVLRSFPTSVIGPNQIVTAGRSGAYAYEPFEVAQCAPKFRVGYRDAFAVSIGVSRLSAYINDYGGFTQALIPVTYTVRFVKLNGAALVFSKSETIYTQFATTRSDFYAPGTSEIAPANVEKVRAAILADGRGVVDRLVAHAAANFQPKQTSVTILAREGPYFIFDRGSEIGFSSNSEYYPLDQAGNEYGFAIRYATDRLAVGVVSQFSKEIAAATQRLSAGATLTFSFDAPGKDDAKLSVMAVQYTTAGNEALDQDLVLNNALQSVLGDDLGYSAPFNLIKQDPDFARLKEQIRAEASCEATMFRTMQGFADNSTERRSDPDLFLKVDHFASPVFTATGVGGTTTNDIFNTAVTLSLVDRSAVIRQSFVGVSPYELVRTAGKGLSLEQAREVNLKNAGLAALKQLTSGFSPKQRSIALASVQGASVTLAEPISPAAFGQARLVRPLRLAAANKTVLLPLPASGEAGVVLEAPAQSTDQLAFRGRDLKSSDLLVLSASSAARKLLRACPASRAGRFLQHASLKHPSGADRLLPAMVGASLKSFDVTEGSQPFLASAEAALRQGFFQTDQLRAHADTSFCVLALELQNLTKIGCASGKCSGSASVASGLRIFNDKAKAAESIVGASFDLQDVDEAQLSNFVGFKAFEHQLKSIDFHKSKLQ